MVSYRHAIVEELKGFGAKVHTCARNEDDLGKCLKEWINLSCVSSTSEGGAYGRCFLCLQWETQHPCNPKKVDHLLNLDGAKERLQLFKEDLLEEGSFDSVVEGCDGVFHTASPVRFVVNDPQVELIDPALKGTLNVLKSCAKSPSVKRVISTSSVSAIAFNTRPKNPEVVVDETWFSDPHFCRESKLWYTLSKTLAEAAAWKFANENRIDMVVINPTMVVGSLLQPEVNESVETILKLINGNSFKDLQTFLVFFFFKQFY
ncbi:unnamed protein product [Trifolium pratense]|uniref:Uncharacterized protein n=1 Tax=Trifolium pratense TaxID=57577 RepID=A0ACB0MDW7_TRIPR|nr:unnamed protein product [Trifolium pratense]